MTTLSRRSAIVSVAALLLPVQAAVSGQPEDEVRAPFGLTWSMSSDEVRKSGVALAAIAEQDYGASFTATNLSKVLSDTASVVLSFGYKDKLWRIAAVGSSIGPDPSGSQVVSRYQDLAVSLSDRYGHGAETDIRDHEVFKSQTEYVMSLLQGRAFRYTAFHSPKTDVELSLRAADADHAYYLILFEYRSGAQEFGVDNKAHEKDVL